MNSYIIYFPEKRVKHKQSYELSVGMSTPRMFGFYGESDSGKTTLIVQLVSQLTKEGYQVATMKQSNKTISMDTKNKDTWRHHQAGANLVVFSSRSETNFLLDAPLRSSETLRRISEFGNFDFILVEGADDPDIPKIQVGKGRKRSNTIAVYKDNFQEIFALFKKQGTIRPSHSDLSIKVNGMDIPLTEFPAQIISNTIVGMLGSLKNVQDIHKVTIELKR
ncbi:MAG TPA: molybdopterin-guanine dinucleotide biosynthesis protein B [Candidatus Thermoplasmatota archaeon]|nr:molybdopterin-guanine dinucleotide biosynthesis protein B [Candidatus Thermoplasmatota archaeon]